MDIGLQTGKQMSRKKLHFLLQTGRVLMSNTPFGLCNAPDTFQYLIQSACARLTLETGLFRMFSKVK